MPRHEVAQPDTLRAMALKKAGDRLKFARVAAGYRFARTFSDKFGIPQSTYSLHESGERPLSQSVAEKYADLLGNCSPAWLLTGEGRGPTDQEATASNVSNLRQSSLAPAPMNLCYIVGAVEAGAWREAIEFPQEEWDAVRFEDFPEFRGAKRFGLRVRGLSMNAHYPHGTVLDCVSFIGTALRPQDGDHVIVTRRGPGDLVEATVKELVRKGDTWELWPRSTHPAHQLPVPLPGIPEDDENEDIRIVALVIGHYTRRPFSRSS